MIRIEAEKAVATSFAVILDKYNETESRLFVFKNVIGASIAFQHSMKFRISEETTPGIPRGSPILKNTYHVPAPSTFAASSSESGIC